MSEGNFPVAPSKVGLLLHSADGTLGEQMNNGGVYRKCGSILFEKARQSIVHSVRDFNEDITLAMPCHTTHFGVCATKDAAVYSKCCTLAKAIAKFFTAAKCGNFFKLQSTTEDGNYTTCTTLYFAFWRPRRIDDHITHVFCQMDVCNNRLTCANDGNNSFEWFTPWSLAKELLYAHAPIRVEASELEMLRHAGRFEVERVGDPSPVWPKAEPACSSGASHREGIDMLAAPSSKRRRKAKNMGAPIKLAPMMDEVEHALSPDLAVVDCGDSDTSEQHQDEPIPEEENPAK